MTLLLIFLGAGTGGVLRYWVSNLVYWITGRQFPYGTLIVNISGSFLMGLLFVLIIERFNGIGQPLRSLLLIGLLGGYTTFSSFSIETLNLLENGAWLSGLLNILSSVILCMLAVWFGVLLGRQL
ncbi:MAG TPA: fluoride efflux transporter CrcB [Gammaproteobacteria bacterium]|nr:fluoride efflux transporter CrcB [Gammaproteobacteria bacterium]